MKVCIAQINTTPGDFEANKAAILKGLALADAAGVSVIVFPELTIPGYLSQDLIYNRAYVDKNLQVLEEIRVYTEGLNPSLHVVLGYIDRNPAQGKPFLNNAAVIRAGEILAVYSKQLLPFYDVFDELRYFEPGRHLTILDIEGVKTGIVICEDLWNDKQSDDYNYETNPMQLYREQGVKLFLSLNSSPFVRDKVWQRLRTVGSSSEPDLTVVYVNQRGGQDELVFDGHSFVMRDGNLLHLSEEVFEDSYEIVDIGKAPEPGREKIYLPVKRRRILQESTSLVDLLVLGLRDYVFKSGFEEVVVASSGGVDSAVVCLLACKALGPANVHAVRMPSVFSSSHSSEDAKKLHANLGCWDYEMPVDHQALLGQLADKYTIHADSEQNLVTRRMAQGEYASVADENIQARLRDLYLMHFSNAYGAMPLSTGNKTESACGYYTHFDMNFSYAPIKDLYKFQVMEIAKSHSQVPDNIWKKPPSAELSEGQTDEASLLPYAVLDPLVRSYVEEYISDFDDFSNWASYEAEGPDSITMDDSLLLDWLGSSSAANDYARIIRLIGKMEFKRRQTCPGTKVSKVAFGIGRRIPIVQHWV
ncbi:MAG: NAD(+) synthase [Gammaproteobacteria bacterium]|nr:NAD(+) synthase [Gammaproteobacteria bacterium]